MSVLLGTGASPLSRPPPPPPQSRVKSVNDPKTAFSALKKKRWERKIASRLRKGFGGGVIALRSATHISFIPLHPITPRGGLPLFFFFPAPPPPLAFQICMLGMLSAKQNPPVQFRNGGRRRRSSASSAHEIWARSFFQTAPPPPTFSGVSMTNVVPPTKLCTDELSCLLRRLRGAYLAGLCEKSEVTATILDA